MVFLIIVTLYWRIHSYLLRQRFSFKSTKSPFARWCYSIFGNRPDRLHQAIQNSPQRNHSSAQVLQRTPYPEDVERGESVSERPWEVMQLSGLAESLMLDVEHESLLQLELDMLEGSSGNQSRSLTPEGSSCAIIPPDTVASSSRLCLDPVVAGDKTPGDYIKADAATDDCTSETGDRVSTLDRLSQEFALCDSKFPCRTRSRDMNSYDAGPDYSGNQIQHPQSTNLRENTHSYRYHTIHQLMTHRAALLFLLFPLTVGLCFFFPRITILIIG